MRQIDWRLHCLTWFWSAGQRSLVLEELWLKWDVFPQFPGFYVRSTPLLNKPWFISPGLALMLLTISWSCPIPYQQCFSSLPQICPPGREARELFVSRPLAWVVVEGTVHLLENLRTILQITRRVSLIYGRIFCHVWLPEAIVPLITRCFLEILILPLGFVKTKSNQVLAIWIFSNRENDCQPWDLGKLY